MGRPRRDVEIARGVAIVTALLGAPRTRQMLMDATGLRHDHLTPWIDALRASGALRVCGFKSSNNQAEVFHLQVPFAQEDVKR